MLIVLLEQLQTSNIFVDHRNLSWSCMRLHLFLVSELLFHQETKSRRGVLQEQDSFNECWWRDTKGGLTLSAGGEPPGAEKGSGWVPGGLPGSLCDWQMLQKLMPPTVLHHTIIIINLKLVEKPLTPSSWLFFAKCFLTDLFLGFVFIYNWVKLLQVSKSTFSFTVNHN